MSKIIEKWPLFKYVDGELTPLSKTLETKEQAEHTRMNIQNSSEERQVYGDILSTNSTSCVQYHRIQSEVTMEKVVLVDADRKTRATLRMSKGVPGLILYDNDENVCAILKASDEGRFSI